MRTRIAVVDDEEKILSSLKRYFELQNYHVDTFADPTVALNAIKARLIKVVLCDINMPKMDGIELVGRLKKHNPMIQVVIMTGAATPDRVKAAISQGACGFVVKPFDSLQQVQGEVEKALMLFEKAAAKSWA